MEAAVVDKSFVGMIPVPGQLFTFPTGVKNVYMRVDVPIGTNHIFKSAVPPEMIAAVRLSDGKLATYNIETDHRDGFIILEQVGKMATQTRKQV